MFNEEVKEAADIEPIEVEETEETLNPGQVPGVEVPAGPQVPGTDFSSTVPGDEGEDTDA